MTTPFQSMLSAGDYNNQQLFSDHYLGTILRNRQDWQALAIQAEPAMSAIADILAKYQPSNIEAQVEDQLIKPVLLALGHTYEVQPSLDTPENTKRPDYVFYRDTAALNANKGATLTDNLPKQGAFAVGDAKYWDCPLDKVEPKKGAGKNKPLALSVANGVAGAGTGKAKERNPSAQIAFYILHTGLDWGILTNGRKWRIYHKSNSYKLDRFYEVDLPELAQSGDPLRFLYFYAFFRRAAFDAHPLGLASILEQSAEYARGVGDTLKTQIYEALRHLAQGFLDYTPNNLQSDPAALKEIYDASLIVLYRMLFVLYAEARGLLPLYESAQYRNRYSFKAIKDDVARDLNMGAPLLADSATVWPRFKTLSGIINAGSPPLHVATFNGGLFDPDKHPFLEKYSVGDGHLQRAIDMLARVGGQFVDYRDLAVRHLGTIYEGLLEYHLEPMPTPAGGWSVDLLNDKGERKATGSYYTPDYIVKYIVEQTLGPVLEEAISGLEDDNARANAVLACNVLDPAMGSGHFLVEATEYVARFLVDIGVHPPGSEGDDTDLAYWKRRVVQSCIYGVDLNPLAVELAKLSLWLATVAKDRPLSFLDHHLRAGNSLVGARLSDLEWSNRLTAGQKRVRQQAQKAMQEGQLTIMNVDAFHRSMSVAVGSMWLIEENPGLTIDDVKEQEKIYQSLRDSLTSKYKRLMDLVTATYFGVPVDPSLWLSISTYTTGGGGFYTPKFEEWLDTADKIANERRFFHWELEFPEVFFDRHGQPLGDEAGFDAVVGNPPYVRHESLTEIKPVLRVFHPIVFDSIADLYVYFFGRGLEVLRERGRFGFITSNKFTRAGYGKPLRLLLREQTDINQIIDFGELPVFAQVGTFPAIFLLTKREPTKDHLVTIVQIHRLDNDDLSIPIRRDAAILPQNGPAFDRDGWSLGNTKVTNLISKMAEKSHKLGEYAGQDIKLGIKTGLNAAFVIDASTRKRLVEASPQTAEIIKPLVIGDDIRRYHLRDQGRFLIVLPSGWTRRQSGATQEEKAMAWLNSNYSTITAYLSQFEQSLRNRTDHGEFWWELRPCDYYASFEYPKILYPDIAMSSRFTLDESGYYSSNTSFLIPRDDKYLLAVLNSTLIWFYLKQICSVIGDAENRGRLRMFTIFVERLPVRQISRNTAPDQMESLFDNARALYERGLNEQSPQEMLAFVSIRLAQEPEEADVVHDLLAYLAKQMIDLNKQRQAAVEDFVLDLEGVLSPADLQKIGRLWTPPSNNAEPTTDAVAQLGPLARKRLELRDDIGRITEDQWKWLLKGRLKKIANLAELVRVYRQRQPAIATLDARLAYTDSLIDQVVYRLYGLTEDEVGIVEGTPSASMGTPDDRLTT